MTIQSADPQSLFHRKPIVSHGHHVLDDHWDTLGAIERSATPDWSARDVVAVPKPTRISDPAWLDEIRAMPCCVCVKLGLRQLTRTEPNHTETVGSGGGDDSAAPTCRAHHDLWHMLGRATFAAGTGIDPRAVAAELWHWHETRAF